MLFAGFNFATCHLVLHQIMLQHHSHMGSASASCGFSESDDPIRPSHGDYRAGR